MRISYTILVLLCLAGCRHSDGPTGQIPEYDSVTDCFNGTSIVSRDGKWGIIGSSGRVVIPTVYDNVFYLTDELAAAFTGNICGFYDRDGRRLAEIQTPPVALSSDAILAAYSDIREQNRKMWDDILESYQELSTLRSSEGSAVQQAESLADGIRSGLGHINGPMDKDQQARFEAIRRIRR